MRHSRLQNWRFRSVVAAALLAMAAAPASALTVFGPDLDAMRQHLRRQQASAPPPPPRNVIRDHDRKLAAKRRAAAKRLDPRAAQLRVLTPEAENAYETILDLIDNGRLNEADARIGALKDKVLEGYMLARRYLAKDSRVTYDQLKAWLDRFADHPSAPELYRLALAARPKNAAKPKEPVGPGTLSRLPWVNRNTYLPRPRQSRRQRRRAQSIERQVAGHLKRSRYTRAEKIIERKDTEKLLGPARHDMLKTRLAVHLFQRGQMKKAWELAQPAAQRTGNKIAQAHWIAGLASYALGKSEKAAEHFAAVAGREGESDWFRSGGAYWAARAYAALKDEDKERAWLKRAAGWGRTFYGVLARHRLGMAQAFDWGAPKLDQAEVDRIKASAAGRRALALIQLDRAEAAAEQLLRQYVAFGEKMSGTFAQVAEFGGISELAYAFSRRHYRKTRKLADLALYPLPRWAPSSGFQLDRALIFAMMRQESAFRRRAKSHAGARGLMQLMPATAAFISGDRSLRRAKVDRLFQPALNLTLGQKFLKHLLARPAIQGNLFFAIAAYNAGEGNLNKWKVRDDPLLFIEAIHLHETRGYVERVLYNLWAYRLRLKQTSPSLAAIAAGKWPQYVALDGKKAAATSGTPDKSDKPDKPKARPETAPDSGSGEKPPKAEGEATENKEKGKPDNGR